MGTIINLVAMLILFWYPVKLYFFTDGMKIKNHPFDEGVRIYVNKDLDFLIYSILTAMVFLGPFSLWKYGYWIVALLLLLPKRMQIKGGPIISSYLIFVGWSLISLILISDLKFQGTLMMVKYTLPLLYLWLAYTAINDKDDLHYFMKIVAIGMCVWVSLIGGFAEKAYSWVYTTLAFASGGLVITYASLADFISGLIVVPIGLFILTRKKIWLWATLWIALSTLLAVVRTGLGGIFLAASFLLFTIFKQRSIPWILGLVVVVVGIVFSVPEFRKKMFKDGVDKEATELTFNDANFDTVRDNGRKITWDAALANFYEPSPVTGSGLGKAVNFAKIINHDMHSDYVQILCDLGLIGVVLFGLFVVTAIVSIIKIAWARGCPFYVKLTGGMALGSCAGTFFSMAYDNVMMYSQQSYVLPFVMIGIYLKVKDLYESGRWID